jgi:HK97 family phage prohead protease
MHTLENPTRVKAFDFAQLKAEGQDGLEAGQYSAYAAVFNNVDSYGERLIPGAFEETLADWKASGDPVPAIYSHQWSDPFAHIGFVTDIAEDEHGLRYTAQLDTDDPYAMKVYKLLKGRRLRQQSFGFDIIGAQETKVDDRWVMDITKVKLFEVGPCLVGVNQETSLFDVKSSRQAPSGQGSNTASAPSEEPASKPDEAPASKGLSPASIRLLANTLSLPSEED